MSPESVIVVSDIHLGAVPRSTETSFRAFLASLVGKTSHLLINGDLFDFWFEYRSVIPAKHYRVLAALAELIEAGTRVSFVGGNHDAWGGAFLREEVGIELLDDGTILDLAGWRALVVHGDGRGEGDLGYRVLRRVIRSPVAVRAFRILHPDLGSRIAALASTTETKAQDPTGACARAAERVRRWAERQLREEVAIDLVIAGHTHVPVVAEVLPARYYINTGDWISHFTYLTLDPGIAPRLRVWNGSAPAPD